MVEAKSMMRTSLALVTAQQTIEDFGGTMSIKWT